MKIRKKIQIRFFGIAFILAVSLMSIVYFSMVSHFERQEGDKLKNNVIQSAKSIDNFMFTRVKDLNILSNNPLFSTSSNTTISNYLSRVVEQYPYYDNITFINTEAIILASSSKEHIGLNIIDIEPDIEEEFYKTLNGGDDDVYISDIAKISQKEINENLPLDIELLSNVIDLDGNVIGVLVGFVNVQFIKDITYDIDNRTIGNEYAYLVNSTGDVVISANPKTVILQPHPDLSFKELQRKLKNEENGYIIYKNSKGKKVISGFSDLSEYGTDKVGNWSLISTAPYDDIMVPIYQILYKELITFGVILLLLFLLTINLSRSLSKPITQLQKAVSKFDINNKPLELKIDTKDEVEELSLSFNTMSKNIYNSSEERKRIANLLNESKEQLDNIINNIGDPVFVKDDQSRLLIVNDAFCNIFNLSKPDIIGLTLAEHVTEEERESFLKIDKQVLEDGIENTNEESLTIKDHETRIISTKKTRYIDKNGTKFLIGVIRDITDRKKVEEKILEIQQKLEAAIRIGNIGYWSWDIINDKVEWSDLMYEIYDVDPNTPLKYDTVLSCVHPDDREFHNRLVEQRIKNKDNSPFEYRVLCKDNTIKYVMVQMEVVENNQGEAIAFQGTVIDISERKKAEAKLIESEEYLDNIINNIGDPVFVKDHKSRFLIANDAFYKLFNREKDEILGKIFANSVPPEERERYLKVDNLVLSEGIEDVNEDSVNVEGGETRFISTKKTRFIDEKGNKYLIGVIRDITERKKQEETLKESEAKFRAMVDASPIGIFFVNPDGNVTYGNAADIRMIGLTQEEALGLNWVNAIHPEDRERVTKKWVDAMEAGIPYKDQGRYLHKDGKIVFWDVITAPVIIDNEITGYIGMVVDITEKVKSEEEITKYKNHLEELVELRTNQLEKEKIKAQSADLMKSAFLATMSHELRTPMNSIIGFTGILLKEIAGPLNEEQKKQLEMVKNSGEHLLGLINDVLDISKIEAGKLKVSFYPFNYLSCLEKTIEFLLPQASKKGLDIKTEISSMDITLVSDERRIEQILLNLLSNAIKFSKTGTVLVKVAVKDKTLVTQVIDQGIGISKNDIIKLFMPFIQLEGGLSRNHEGTGLGLAISKNLIEKLGGSIHVESELGKGSNFTFKLPLEHSNNK